MNDSQIIVHRQLDNVLARLPILIARDPHLARLRAAESAASAAVKAAIARRSRDGEMLPLLRMQNRAVMALVDYQSR